MKNIHILSTDQPSRLHYYHSFTPEYALYKEPLNWRTASYIYITSSEEIKQGDYCIDGNDIYGPYEDGDIATHKFIKIILSTDSQLIRYGVQAIDDEFLEWFVKNSSCEFVNIHDICDNVYVADYLITSTHVKYEIIIPQEEPKHSKVSSENGNELSFDKQGNLIKETVGEKVMPLDNENIPEEEETLEDYIERETESIIEPEIRTTAQIFMRYGANWQSERMYTEEDLREAFKQSRQCKIFEKDMPPIHNEFEDWFEQFKKN